MFRVKSLHLLSILFSRALSLLLISVFISSTLNALCTDLYEIKNYIINFVSYRNFNNWKF